MESYTLYLVLLGALLALVFFGAAIKKLLKKADIEIDDDQLDLVQKALSDAVDKVEEISAKQVTDGGRPMTDAEKKDLTISVAKDLAKIAGISDVKLDLLLKMLDAVTAKKLVEKKRIKKLRAQHKQKLTRDKRRATKDKNKGKGKSGI